MIYKCQIWIFEAVLFCKYSALQQNGSTPSQSVNILQIALLPSLHSIFISLVATVNIALDIEPCTMHSLESLTTKNYGKYCEIKYCEIKYREIKYCEIKYCDIKYCEIKYCEIKYCEIKYCEIKYCEIKYCEIKYCEIKYCEI